MGTHFDGNLEEKRALDAYIKLSRAAEAVSHCINEHLRTANLTVSQFGVLEALYHLGPLQPRQLGEKILRSSGNMTLVIDNLVKRGLVVRQRRTDDRRRVDVELTEMGRELVTAVLPTHVQGVVNTFTALSIDEIDQLAALCKKLGLAQDMALS